jgi:hypothetical protein
MTTADLVTIGQVWKRRRDGLSVRVHMVRRQARQITATPVEPVPGVPARFPVGFSELRAKWKLVAP